VTSFSGGSAPQLIYLSLSGNTFTTEYYNAFLSGWSQQTFTGGDKYLIANPAQYGGCNVPNQAEGVAARAALMSSGRAIADGGESVCSSAPSVPTPTPSGGGG
jgi:hypothetical protein